MAETLTNFYWLLLPQLVVEAFRYAPWKKARKRGILAVLAEIFKCLTLTNVHAFQMVADTFSPGQVQQLLADHGVPSFGFAYYANYECIFHVPANRRKWAEECLHWAGVTLI